MNHPRTNRRKTSSPQKVIKEKQQVEIADSDDPTLSLEDYICGNPKDLAKYIKQQSLSNFVEVPQLPDIYYEEIANAKLHQKTGQEIQYNCRGCNNKVYRSAGGLKAHVLHCPQLPKNGYTCVVCSEKFDNQTLAKTHIEDVHVNPYLDETKVSGRRAAAISRMKINTYEAHSSASEELSMDDTDFNINEEPPEMETQEEYDDSPAYRDSFNERIPSISGSTHTYVSLHTPLAMAMEWTHDRISEMERLKIGVKILLPKTELHEVSFSMQHFQLQSNSPWFGIDCTRLNLHAKKPRHSLTQQPGFQTLSLFHSMSVDENHSKTLFTGAPVWSMAWCPYPNDKSKRDQILALCNHMQEHLVDPIHTYHEPTIVQLWNCGKLSSDPKNNDITMPFLALGLAINQGPVWDLKWCPYGGFVQTDNQSRLGILALACASGKVLIIVVPTLKERNAHSENSQNNCEQIKRVNASLTLSPQKNNQQYGQCFSVSWSVIGHNTMVAGGFASGHVAIWCISSHSKLLGPFDQEGEQTMFPFVTFRAHSKPVSSLAWSPFDEHILATGGADRLLKVWDKRRTSCDLRENLAPRASIIHEITWPLLYNGVYMATDSSFSIPHSHGGVYVNLGTSNSLQSLFPCKACSFTITQSDWLNSAACGDVSGNAMVMTCNNWSRLNAYSKKIPRILLFRSDPIWPEEEKTFAAKLGEETDSECSYEYKLMFFDTDMTGTLFDWEKRVGHKTIRTHEDFQDEVYHHPVSSINKMRWNPNLSSYTWIASGTQSGLVRLHCVSGLVSKDVKDIETRCLKV